MPRQLNSLAEDIYKLLDRGVKFTPTPEYITQMTTNLARHLASALDQKNKPREMGKAWFSDLGEKCDRKTHYKWNPPSTLDGTPESIVEVLPGATNFKFLYGDILEEQVLYLAKESNHNVAHEQHRIEYQHTNHWQVSGRIDAVIDGVLVDVKSTSSFGYRKYTKEGLTTTNDSFGYAGQPTVVRPCSHSRQSFS